MGNSASSETIPEPKVVIRPMLTTAPKNFKIVEDFSTIVSSFSPPNITREELSVPGSRCFLLRSLLTPEECAHYIHETERVGYSDLTAVFPVKYRSNDRILSISKGLVECLWMRIEPYLTRREIICIRPVGFGNEGTWKPFRLNECCKFGKYKRGDHFSPHLDGPWVPRDDESSIFTVVIYLNSEFKGGSTTFLSEKNGDVLCSVSPKAGTALIFNHDTLHDGQPVTEGTKYIIRTEIMFRRVDTEMLPNPNAYEKSEKYIKTLTLYQKSWQLEQAGDIQGFNDTYLEGLALQCQEQRSVGKDAVEIFEQTLPYDIYLKVFGYLSCKELCKIMTVCKAWYTMCMDGQLWYDLYKQRCAWSHCDELETQLDHIKKTFKRDRVPFTKDWYGRYKQRVVTKAAKYVACVDLGSFSCKFAMLNQKNGTITTSSVESVVALVPGLYDLHLRRNMSSYYGLFSGNEAKQLYPGHTYNVISKGVPHSCDHLYEILHRCFEFSKASSARCPMVVLEPPGLWNDKIRSEIAAPFLILFHNPSLVYISSAVAVLAGLNMLSGVVLDIGWEKVTCAAVWRGNQCPKSLSCDTATATTSQLVTMVHTTVLSCGDNTEKQSTFKNHIVIIGENKETIVDVKQELIKEDSMYHVIEPADSRFIAVKGGCSIAMLTSFPGVKTFPIKKADSTGINEFYYKVHLPF